MSSKNKVPCSIYFLFFVAISCNNTDFGNSQEKMQKVVIQKYLDQLRLTTADLQLKGKVKQLIEYKVINEPESTDYPEIAYHDKNYEIVGDIIKEGDYYLILERGITKRIRLFDIEDLESFEFSNEGDLLKELWYHRSNDRDKVDLLKNQYDLSGKLVAQREFDYSGQLFKQIDLSYNQTGQLIRISRTTNYSDGKSEKDYEIKYHLDTTFIERTDTSRGFYEPHIEIYDENGTLVENDPRLEKIYTRRGEFQKSIDYFMNGEKQYSETYEYDQSGNEIAKTEYDSSGGINYVERKYYSDSGKLVMINEIGEHSYEFKRFNRYGIRDAYTRIQRNGENSDLRDYREVSNEHGDVIHIVEMSLENNGQIKESRIDIDYEYDQYGNWIAKKIYQEDTLRKTTKRVINYY